MYHVALNRTGADDGDLDHQIVEFFRPQPWQHVHLCPAFHLKHAHAVTPTQHVIGWFVIRWDGSKIVGDPVLVLQQVEAFADAGQHTQGQHIDLQDAEFINVILVPFDETAIGHGGISDRHGVMQRTFGQDETANMLGKMAGDPDHLPGKAQRPRHQRIGKIHPRLG